MGYQGGTCLPGTGWPETHRTPGAFLDWKTFNGHLTLPVNPRNLLTGVVQVE